MGNGAILNDGAYQLLWYLPITLRFWCYVNGEVKDHTLIDSTKGAWQ